MSERTVIARSIGSRAATVLRPGTTGRVLASFPRVCDLVTDDGAVIAIAESGAEKGPLTVLFGPDRAGGLMEGLPPGAGFQVGKGELRLTPSSLPRVRVDLSGAACWEARLHWEALQPRHQQIRSSAGLASRTAREARGLESGPRWERRLNQASEAILQAQRAGDWNAMRAAVRDLCGLGEGLTPQGDDWLAGWLQGTRLVASGDPIGWASGVLGALVLDVASKRTTILSRAFLACAAAGEAPESWHLLLSQMAQNPVDELALEGATRTILSHGATSGRATLEGFLAGLSSGLVPRPPIRGERTLSIAME
jgi:hypothetical protein